MNLLGMWIGSVHQRQQLQELIIDIDRFRQGDIGAQESLAYNSHFAYTCYHLLFLLN